MKFDIARAWKDESYRENLSVEDMSLLPMNPVGVIELTDTEIEGVFGGGGGGFGGGGGVVTPPPGVGFGVGGNCGGSCFSSQYSHNASVALICEINIFSISILGNIALLGNVTQACIKG